MTFPTIPIEDACSLIVDCVNRTAPKVAFETPWKMLRTPNIRSGRINTQGVFYVDEETYKAWTRRATIQIGDTILTREAPVGEVGLVREAEGFFLGQRLMQYRANPEVMDGLFLNFAMRSPILTNQFHAFGGTGSVVDHLKVPDCRRFLVPLPPLETQREIAAILGVLDDKIELNRKTAATLEEMARALYRSWFVDFDSVHAKAAGRPPAHMDEATAALFPNKFGEDGLPEGWERQSFPDLIEIVSGGTPKTSVEKYWHGDLPWYSVVDAPDARQVFVINTEKMITEDGFKSCSAKIIPKGVTIISARGTVGKLAMAGQEMVFNQSCYGLQGRGIVGNAFTYFSAVRAVEELRSMAHGSVFSTITRETFGGIELVQPTPTLFETFEKLVGSYFAQMHLLTQQNQTLATLRDTLLPRLMSGKLQVGEASKQVEGLA